MSYENALDSALGLIRARVLEAVAKHGPFADRHHVYGVLAEEVDEFFDSVKANDGHDDELADVAVVAIRAWVQLFCEGLGEDGDKITAMRVLSTTWMTFKQVTDAVGDVPRLPVIISGLVADGLVEMEVMPLGDLVYRLTPKGSAAKMQGATP